MWRNERGAAAVAGKLAGASTLVVEIDQARIDRRIASGYCDASTDDLDEAIKRWTTARDAKPAARLARACAPTRPCAVDVAGRDLVRSSPIETFPDPLKGYVPIELSLEGTRDAARRAGPG
jgi:urocanate hydratase